MGTEFNDLVQSMSGLFKAVIENEQVNTAPSPSSVKHSPMLAGPVMAKNMLLLTEYQQNTDPGGNDFWVDYDNGEISFNNPMLPQSVAVSYCYDPASEAVVYALLDLNRRLSFSKTVLLTIPKGESEVDLPFDFLFVVEATGDCLKNGYECTPCDLTSFSCGKLILSKAVSCDCIICLKYGAGYLPDDAGIVDLPSGYEEALRLKTMAIMMSLPNVQSLGIATPQGGLTERTYQIGDERVTKKWDKGQSLMERAKSYQEQYENLVDKLVGTRGLRGDGGRESKSYHGIRC